MAEYKTILTVKEIDAFVKSVPSYQVFFFVTNKIIYAERQDKSIILKGLFFSTKAKVVNTDHETIIVMNTKCRFYLYLISLFVLAFFSILFFVDNVTINGHTDPSIIERLIFTLIGLVFFSIPLGIFVKLKSDFIKQIENELKLKRQN